VSNPRVLVVFYSRDGHTRRVAQDIVSALGCDAEEVFDTRNRKGILGFLMAGFDAGRGALTVLKPTQKDPAAYDLVVVGTPVWNGSVSTPMRTYLTQNKDRFKQVAFFMTCGGPGTDKVFGQMTECSGRQPLARLALTQQELAGDYAGRVNAFVAEITRG